MSKRKFVTNEYVIPFEDITNVVVNLGSAIRLLENNKASNRELGMRHLKQIHNYLNELRDERTTANEINAKYIAYLQEELADKMRGGK